MVLTLSVVHIPASDAVVVVTGVFLTPATSSGEGSILSQATRCFSGRSSLHDQLFTM